MVERYEGYRRLIKSLDKYRKELGIPDEPNAVVIVVPGTEDRDRPVGSLLPVYPDYKTGIGDGKIQRILFNLKSLTGFDPREAKT